MGKESEFLPSFFFVILVGMLRGMDLFLLGGKEVLLQRNAKLLAEGLELLEVLVVLTLGVNLGLDACIIR